MRVWCAAQAEADAEKERIAAKAEADAELIKAQGLADAEREEGVGVVAGVAGAEAVVPALTLPIRGPPMRLISK